MIEVRLEQLTKRFGDVTAVDGFSLTVSPREFLVAVGPSGCGKTTLLRLIAGLEDPDSGRIYLGGVPANAIPVGKRNVQLIFQSYALPHMRVMGGPHRHHAGRPAGPGGNREAATGAPRRQVRERVLGKLMVHSKNYRAQLSKVHPGLPNRSLPADRASSHSPRPPAPGLS